MKLLLVFFSATGNTAKMAQVIGREFGELGVEVHQFDITSPSEREKELDLDPFGGMIFGSPVHARRTPKPAREWLKALDGRGKRCSTFFTYGGFKIHPCHCSTGQILHERGFQLVSSAEFLGAHTFNLAGWKAMRGRPDDSDFKVAREYVLRTYKRFKEDNPGSILTLEKTKHSEKELDRFEDMKFKIITQLPTRKDEACSMCMKCEELCPTGAMNADKGAADRAKCIVCLRCLANCPEDALQVNDLTANWAIRLRTENETEQTLASKRSRVYL